MLFRQNRWPSYGQLEIYGPFEIKANLKLTPDLFLMVHPTIEHRLSEIGGYFEIGYQLI